MSIEEYNDELTKIKQFHTYLSKILDSGYMNELDDLKMLNNQLDNINIKSSTSADYIDENITEYDNNQLDSDYDCIPFIPSRNYTYSSDSISSSSSSTEDEDIDYNSYNTINKEQEKVNKFINNNDIYQRCGNISLYRANGFDYIDTMKKFIKKTFIY